MEYIADRETEQDKDYFGFILRTRKGSTDYRVIDEVLANNFYKVPGKLNTVIDIGAHIGTFSLKCARAGAKVYAFEPEMSNYKTLVHNVEINGFVNKIECIKAGVGKKGKTKLFVHPYKTDGSSAYVRLIRGLEKEKYQMVDFISVKDVFEFYNIKHCDLLKMDCEGSEKDIFEDIDDYVERIDQISAELHNGKQKDRIVQKMSKWYNIECTNRRRRVWVFKKK